MEHRKLDALMSPMERIARVAAAGVSASRAQQTSPSGAISLDNADGTRTIIGEVVNGEDNPSYTMATHVGDTTPPGVPTGITATSRSGVVVVEWDGTLSGGIPDDFFCVRVYLDNVELGALSEAGSVASAKLESGTTHSVTATSEDDCCLPDGTPAHNVSDATQAISVTVAKDASEVMADIDEQIEGVEQEIADFKSNTYTKAQTDKVVQDLDDEISTELTTNYYNKNQIDTTYATKTLVSQTKEEIELSASQTYATKGAGNPNLSPLTAHDTQDRYNASTNPDGYWRADVRGYENIEDGWVHVIRNASTATQWGQQFQTMPLPILKPSTKYTLLMEYRNVSVTGTLRAWPLYASSDQFVYPPETTAFDVDRDMVVRAQLMTKDSFEGVAGGVDVRHALYPPGDGSGSCSYDLRLSIYECELDGNGDPIPYEGSYKPYVTDQQALGKTYATNSALTVGLDGIRQEVASEYQSIDAMGAYSTTAEMNAAIQTSATGIEQSVAATYTTKQATADAIAAIQVGGRNLITLAETYDGYVNSSGTDGGSDTNYFQRRSGYIPATAGETYQMQVWGTPKSGYALWCCIAFYDSSKALVGTRTASFSDVGATHHGISAVAPSGTAYMRVAWTAGDNGHAKLEKGTTPTDYTAAPEDLEARPNLVPYGTHDFADVYDATANPDGYWRTTPQSQYFTQLDDGWVHVHIDNSAGTGTPVPNSLRPRQVDGLEGGELVTLLLEVRNNHSTTTGTATTSRLYVQAASGDQLYGNAPQTSNLTNDSISYPLREGESFVKRMVFVTDTEHLPTSGVYGEAFRLGFRTEAGVNLDFELRASLYRGGYEGGYVPYSIEDTTLSKTYTKSSTFTQTVNGLDGRITATEDGLAVQETLIRQYAGGVLVAYTGNPVGALVNAAGQYDIVSLTWQDGEPTVGTTLAKFGEESRIGASGGMSFSFDSKGIYLAESNLNYFSVKDLRGDDGLAQVVMKAIAEGPTPTRAYETFALPVAAESIVSVTLDSSETDRYYLLDQYTLAVENTRAGNYVYITYKTSSSSAKAMRFGLHNTWASAGLMSVNFSGGNSQASGYGSFALGMASNAGGDYSLAGGLESDTVGESSIAFGNHLSTRRRFQAVFGTLNAISYDALLIIGNGSDASGTQERSNAFQVNEDGTVIADGHSVTPVELFSGSTAGTVTLSETAANFERLVICYEAGGFGAGSVEVWSPNGKNCHVGGTYYASAGSIIQQRWKVLQISGTSITRVSSGYINTSTAGAVTTNTTENAIAITKVIGYRKVS